MTSDDTQYILDELAKVIEETRSTLTRFEETSMDSQMPQDYAQLHEIYTQAVKDQWHYTEQLLNG
ncbi:hypothetical protein VRRI112168_15640 [Vreelandella rituensis]|uniref:Uncharacterized protein n=1 Tax=Vreelandella rituensis TaxID=2282306 RepID=A0A368TRL7_9GAMM|nr:hypothetical protein [Halomonas rituensis]RCV86782.1 hypothetical protein DU506_17820 [Halomonas rituensis]